jgi:hypothetical protein
VTCVSIFLVYKIVVAVAAITNSLLEYRQITPFMGILIIKVINWNCSMHLFRKKANLNEAFR